MIPPIWHSEGPGLNSGNVWMSGNVTAGGPLRLNSPAHMPRRLVREWSLRTLYAAAVRNNARFGIMGGERKPQRSRQAFLLDVTAPPRC